MRYIIREMKKHQILKKETDDGYYIPHTVARSIYHWHSRVVSHVDPLTSIITTILDLSRAQWEGHHFLMRRRVNIHVGAGDTIMCVCMCVCVCQLH